MQINYLLLDLDNTLYNASTGLFEEISRRMTAFVAGFFKIPADKAASLRMEYSNRYGTTLGGLLAEGGLLDPEQFIHDVHPTGVDQYIPEDPALGPMLESIPLPKAILTNSPSEHADRVLARLGIRDCFEHIFDIRFSGFMGKPVTDCYTRVCAKIKREPREVLFLDDLPQYLEAFRLMGGNVLLVGEHGNWADSAFPRIREISELAEYLEKHAGVKGTRRQ